MGGGVSTTAFGGIPPITSASIPITVAPGTGGWSVTLSNLFGVAGTVTVEVYAICAVIP